MSDILTQEISPGELGRQMLVDLRRRIANNEDVPEEELAAGLLKIREMYGKEKAAAKTKPKARAAKKKPAKSVNADDLLNGLLGDL